MRITDILGRTVNIDVVVKTFGLDDGCETKALHAQWMQPLSYSLHSTAVQAVRVPDGPFALRVMSRWDSTVRLYLDGRLLLSTVVSKGIQFLTHDGSGKPLVVSFTGTGTKMRECAYSPAKDGADGSSLKVPSGGGLLVVVAGFAYDENYRSVPQPAGQEWEIVFQLQSPHDHYLNLARSLSRLNQPEVADEDNAGACYCR